MRYDLQLRPGLTAIAAVIALSATPAFAQDTTSAAAQPPTVAAPVDAAPLSAEPVVAAPVEISPTLSQAEPAPAQPEISAAPAPAPVPTMEPIVHQPSAADLRAARTIDRAPAAPRAAASASMQRSVAAATAPVAATPTPGERTATNPAQPGPTVAAPVRAQRASTTTVSNGPDILPYAGIGAAALLLLGGGFAMSRRRRDEELSADEVASEPVLDLEPTARIAQPAPTVTEPAFATPAFTAPAMARAETPASALPSGFDLSRYGRHTQAAYQGPTPENPSFSLRKRLKRASFFDGRERIAAETGNASLLPPLAAAARTGRAPVTSDGQIVIRPRPAKTGNFLRPSFALAR